MSENQGCHFGQYLKGLGWECSSSLSNFNDWKCTEGRTKLSYLCQAFSDVDSFSLPEEKSALICSKCMEVLTTTPSRSCQGLNHPSSIKRGLSAPRRGHFITAREYLTLYRGTSLKPNQVLCKAFCFKDPSANTRVQELDSDTYQPPPSKKNRVATLNTIIQQVDGVNQLTMGKRNIAAQSSIVNRTIKDIDEKLRSSFKEQGLKIDNPPDFEYVKKLERDSEDLYNLMYMLKDRIQDCSKAEIKSLLTLCPGSWTHKQAAKFFDVPESLIRSSRKLARESCGVLPQPKTKNGKKLSVDTKTKVTEFYYQDDVSRCSPGAKDVVSVKDPITGKREKKQKKYMLANLKELYQVFKELNPALKIGMSAFISLRPKEILSHTTKGHHNVCLCIYHENVKLLFNAINQASIKPHIASMVCNVEEKNCMYRRCDNCKDRKFETAAAIRNIINSTEKTIIRYKAWCKTDGTSFIEEEKSAEMFESHIVDELEALLKHHYLSQAQYKHFKETRDNLKPGELIIWGDFAENYSPIIQDSIQQEYYSHAHKKQITVHPFSVYLRHNNELFSFAFCVISDCLEHETNTVFVFQNALIKELRRQFSCLDIEKMAHIYYYSDGCAAQYKNRKNFTNLFYHESDFKITAEWHFYPTAHGKGPVDGYGGTTKRLARSSALKGNRIISAEDLYNFARKNITQIEYIFVKQEEVDQIVESHNLAVRYEKLPTSITGTRQAHCVRIEGNKIVLYQTSEDSEYLTSKVVEDQKINPATDIDESAINDWICGAYSDGKWYVGVIKDVDMEEQEVKVEWYKGASKKRGTSFSPEGNTTWLPFGRILKKFLPLRASSSGRTVTITLALQDEFDLLLQQLLA